MKKKVYLEYSLLLGLISVFISASIPGIPMQVQDENCKTSIPEASIDFPINVTSPSKGEKLQRGIAHDIKWTSPGCDDAHVDIALNYRTGGIGLVSIVNKTDNNGQYMWIVPNDLVDGDAFSIFVIGHYTPSEVGISEEFYIYPEQDIEIISPNASSQWELGSTQEIKWRQHNIGHTNVELYRDGKYEMRIGTDILINRFNWTIPSNLTPSSNYTIKVYRILYENDYNFSASFEILSNKVEDASNNDLDSGSTGMGILMVGSAAGVAIVIIIAVKKLPGSRR